MGLRGKWDFCLAEVCVFLLFVGVFYTFLYFSDCHGQGAGGKRSAKQSYIVHWISKTAKEFKYHGILICSLNQSIERNPFRVLFHGVYEKESLYVKKELFFLIGVLICLHEECKQYFTSLGSYQFMYNRNVCSRHAVMETTCVSLGWNYAFYEGMGEFCIQLRTKHFINGTGHSVAMNSCQLLIIIALLARNICF